MAFAGIPTNRVVQMNWKDPTGVAAVQVDVGNGNKWVGGSYGGWITAFNAPYGPNRFNPDYCQIDGTIFNLGASAGESGDRLRLGPVRDNRHLVRPSIPPR